MTTTNLKEADYLKCWGIFFVLAFIGGAIAGGIAGGLVGAIFGGLRASPRFISMVSGGVGFLVSMPVSYFCFRFAVTRFLLPKITSPEPSVIVPLKAAA